ncbi:carbon-nitrogen hydrolase [Campylobacter pinnipediorum subsp. caledonicus]|uniref:carbon-nitrogen hydrolase n=1 Tax=Campylobacter pinnipediorum TaxID=1965231 RepID=UPI000995AA72|nr:carbon-nitrogen hydrolase [Campylobacter pinnipediorum]OPA72101.1 carbon-nitrogen hydrolase [Campylobacter pinnipediorum subsp. caledonicus]
MKVALIQQKFHKTKKQTVEKTLELIEQASKNGAELVVLQELHQTQYFCQSEDVEFFDLANEYKSDIEFWANVAKENKVVLVTSLFEKRTTGLYHNTAYVFEKDGSLAGKYRKMHIPDDPLFYEKFYFTPGDIGFEPIDTSVGRLGVLVCWDQWYPEAARLMALKGADILIYPTAIGWFDLDGDDEKSRQLEAWVAVQRGHSVANGLPVVTVNRVGFEKDESCVSDGIRFWGNSFVFGPQGEQLFRADSEKEECFIVDVDMKKSEDVRRIWPFLRDRRIDSYSGLLKRFIN